MTLFGKVLLGLILATAAFLIVRGAAKKDDVVLAPVEETSATEPVPAEEEALVFTGSTKDLLARGGDYKCTFAQEVENSKSTGTVYISGEKLRGDFKTEITATGPAMLVESHMISDGEFMYTWSSMMPTGFKMNVTETSETATITPSQQGFDANVDIDYNCVAWTPEESQFSLPSTVTFSEIKIPI